MKYMLMICSDGQQTEEKTSTMRRELPGWVERNDRNGTRLFGHALSAPTTAKTVRVREAERLVSDGPFVESKEFVGGFDIIECENLDEAIEAASKHPVSWFHAIEVRPFRDGCIEIDADDPLRAPPTQGGRFLTLMCLDGIPEAPEVEEAIGRESREWGARLQERGVFRIGHPLAHASTATTVRVRDGETLLSDGPFVETKEFVGGFSVIDCESIEQAVDFAAEHPLARFHMLEVRPFATDLQLPHGRGAGSVNDAPGDERDG